jgi:hypothetical protein
MENNYAKQIMIDRRKFCIEQAVIADLAEISCPRDVFDFADEIYKYVYEEKGEKPWKTINKK